ncbi:unnamed protein product [Withania somnifera]
MIESRTHSYHLVDPSPWPISGSLGALATIIGGVMYMHSFQGGATLLVGPSYFSYITCLYGGVMLCSFCSFRASSHSSLAPTVKIGGICPPKGIAVLDPWEISFLNTLIPLSSDIYGSTFFLATGFHGFHVIIGTIFSIICGIRQYLGHTTKEYHVGFEVAAWYWHFVDVVRLFLFVSIYWWGGI